MKSETPSKNTGEKKSSRRIARFFLPEIDPGSSLLPADGWIMRTVYDVWRESKTLKRESLRTASFSALALASAAGAAAVGLLAAPLAPAAVIMLAGALAGGALFFVHRMRRSLDALRSEGLAELRGGVKTRYLKLKSNELMDAWKARLAEKRQAKIAERKPGETPEKPLPEASPEPAGAAAARKKEPVEKESVGVSLGKWALKKAFEKKPGEKNAPPPGNNRGPEAKP